MYPSFEEIQTIASSGNYRRIPVCEELFADSFTPVEVMRCLRSASCHCFLLESAERDQKWGRWSFLGYQPSLELTCSDGTLRIRSGDEENFQETVIPTPNPGEKIRELLHQYKSPKLPGLPPFTGGFVGYFSYDYIKYTEPVLQENAPEARDFRDVDLMLFDQVIVFDHYRQKLLIIAGVSVEDIEHSYQKAKDTIQEIIALLNSNAKAHFPHLHLKTALTPRFTQAQYGEMVEKAKQYIHEGDIFQVVLSNPMTAAAQGSLFDTYRVLRASNPSPYMFYFSSDDLELAGASPETLAKLTDKTVYTFPLAGTRKRGKTDEEDLRLEQELLCDEKELAEHNMLVDLGRNDVGRISQLGSVKVEQYLTIQRFSHVMHIGSTVSGILQEGKDAVDAINSILPAGTLSGAPKLRACQIIQELEGRKRGIYGGAIGYLDFSGNMDSCIAIRLVYKKNGNICIQSGAGIVADSIPEKEFEECLNKAQAVINAVKCAEEGIA